MDLVRAAAYRRAGVAPVTKKEGDKLNLVQVSRVNKRRILNEQELFAALQEQFADKVDVTWVHEE